MTRLALLLRTLVCLAASATNAVSPVHAQAVTVLTVSVEHQGNPVEGAQVTAGNTGGLTDADGLVTLRVPPGPVAVRVERIGFAPVAMDVVVPPSGSMGPVTIELEAAAVEAACRGGCRGSTCRVTPGWCDPGTKWWRARWRGRRGRHVASS